MDETKHVPTLDCLISSICDKAEYSSFTEELSKYPAVESMDDLGLKFLLYKLNGLAQYEFKEHGSKKGEFNFDVVHRTLSFMKEAYPYIQGKRLKEEVDYDISVIESRLNREVDSIDKYMDQGSNLELSTFASMMISKGNSDISKDRNDELKGRVWGDDGNSDTLVGSKSELFTLALGYLKQGLFTFVLGDREKAQEIISIANEELNELSDLLKSRSNASFLADQYYRFHKEISALGFDVENYFSSISGKAFSLPYGDSDGVDITKNDVNAAFAEFYSTPGIPLQFNRLSVSKDEECELARKIFEAYFGGLNAMVKNCESAYEHDEPESPAEGALEKLADMSADSGAVYHFKDKVVRSLSGCENIPVLNYFTSGIKREYDTALAWDILKDAVPVFAEERELTDLSRKIHDADTNLINEAINHSGLGKNDDTPFSEKLMKSFDYIKCKLKGIDMNETPMQKSIRVMVKGDDVSYDNSSYIESFLRHI